MTKCCLHPLRLFGFESTGHSEPRAAREGIVGVKPLIRLLRINVFASFPSHSEDSFK